MYKKAGKLEVGDAFEYEGNVYIAFCLTPDPFGVWCIDVTTKKIAEVDESELVKLIKGWTIVEDLTKPRSGERLEIP